MCQSSNVKGGGMADGKGAFTQGHHPTPRCQPSLAPPPPHSTTSSHTRRGRQRPMLQAMPLRHLRHLTRLTRLLAKGMLMFMSMTSLPVPRLFSGLLLVCPSFVCFLSLCTNAGLSVSLSRARSHTLSLFFLSLFSLSVSCSFVSSFFLPLPLPFSPLSLPPSLASSLSV